MNKIVDFLGNAFGMIVLVCGSLVAIFLAVSVAIMAYDDWKDRHPAEIEIRVGDKCLVGYISLEEVTVTGVLDNRIRTKNERDFIYWYERKNVKSCFSGGD